MKAFLRFFCKLTGALPTWLYFKPKVYYENKKNKKSTLTFNGPAIIITNHKNYLDYILMVLLFLFRHFRGIVGKTMYECNPFLTFMLKAFGAIKLDRFSFDMDFFYESMQTLEKKGLILVFPEGEFSLEGKLKPFKETAALLAVQAGVPILPIYHSYNYGLFRRTKVCVGETIDLRQYCSNQNPSVEELKELTMMLQNKVQELGEICENKGRRK